MNKLIQHAGDMQRVAKTNGAAHPLGYYVAQLAGRDMPDGLAAAIEDLNEEHEVKLMLTACMSTEIKQ